MLTSKKPKSASAVELPRYWKRDIAKLTGLEYCDRHCGCGENNQLWWFPTTSMQRSCIPEWVPGWMNGADTNEIWRWLVENDRAGMTVPG